MAPAYHELDTYHRIRHGGPVRDRRTSWPRIMTTHLPSPLPHGNRRLSACEPSEEKTPAVPFTCPSLPLAPFKASPMAAVFSVAPRPPIPPCPPIPPPPFPSPFQVLPLFLPCMARCMTRCNRVAPQRGRMLLAGLGPVSPPSLAACPSYLAPDPWMLTRSCLPPLVSATWDKPSTDTIGGGTRGAPAGLSGLGKAADGSLSWPLWCCDEEERRVRVRWRSGRALWMSDGRSLVGRYCPSLEFNGSLSCCPVPSDDGKGTEKGAGGAHPRFR